jgi:hypothetical protein
VLTLTAFEVLPVAHLWQILMLPAYVIHLVLVGATLSMMADLPSWWWVVTVPLRLAPFLGLDYALYRASRPGPPG